jgi:glutamate/aspartate transport system substrate-binding protein
VTDRQHTLRSQKLKTPRAAALAGILFAVLFSASDGRNLQDITMVTNGTIDLECGTTTNTLSRQEQVDFSHMTFVDGGSLLVHIASNINGLSDIAGKRIAVILGTTTEKVMAEVLQKANIEVELIRVRKHSDGIAALENGTVDAYASDRVILIGLALTSKEPTKLALADQYLSGEGAIHEHADGAYRLLTRSDL